MDLTWPPGGQFTTELHILQSATKVSSQRNAGWLFFLHLFYIFLWGKGGVGVILTFLQGLPGVINSTYQPLR